MLHLFVIDNECVPDLMFMGRYMDVFTEKLAYDDFNGMALMAEMKETERFNLAYVRIQNDTEKHKDKVYVLVRFDHKLFPQMEGYVERRVMPEFDRVMDTIEEMFGLDLDDQIDIYDEEKSLARTLYVYDADTDGINDAISGWLRENMMEEVTDDTQAEPSAANDAVFPE